MAVFKSKQAGPYKGQLANGEQHSQLCFSYYSLYFLADLYLVTVKMDKSALR